MVSEAQEMLVDILNSINEKLGTFEENLKSTQTVIIELNDRTEQFKAHTMDSVDKMGINIKNISNDVKSIKTHIEEIADKLNNINDQVEEHDRKLKAQDHVHGSNGVA